MLGKFNINGQQIFKRKVCHSIWMEQVLLIKWIVLTKSELEELLPGECCRSIGRSVAHFMVEISCGKGAMYKNNTMVEKKLQTCSYLFLNIFSACFKKDLTQRKNFYCEMVMFQRKVWKSSLPKLRLALENLPFQQEV